MRHPTACKVFLLAMGYIPQNFCVWDGTAATVRVELRNITVADARRTETSFEITLSDTKQESCKKLLLATGMVDRIPPIEGIEALYGTSVFHCPYCDAWRDVQLAIEGARAAFAMNAELRKEEQIEES